MGSVWGQIMGPFGMDSGQLPEPFSSSSYQTALSAGAPHEDLHKTRSHIPVASSGAEKSSFSYLSSATGGPQRVEAESAPDGRETYAVRQGECTRCGGGGGRCTGEESPGGEEEEGSARRWWWTARRLGVAATTRTGEEVAALGCLEKRTGGREKSHPHPHGETTGRHSEISFASS
jgi:hypothetical protein